MADLLMSHRDSYLHIFFYCYCISNSFSIGILYIAYFERIRLLMSSDVEENPGATVSSRLSCCVF